jgi:catechol 2,3-dioxygenase-like lactoylglutathione lyase family enzyme
LESRNQPIKKQGITMKTKVRLEGLTLTVKNVKRSLDYYTKKLGFACEINAAPQFAMIRVGGPGGGTIGLLAWSLAKKEGAAPTTAKQNKAIHVELSTDHLDALYDELLKKGVKFDTPPHDEPWERSATALDPDGYLVEFAQGHRGKNGPRH